MFYKAPMQVDFTKMQGAGNDFVVLDERVHPFGLSAAQMTMLADRRCSRLDSRLICGDQQVVAFVGASFGQFEADAGRGAGDDGERSGSGHAELLSKAFIA